MSLWDSHQLAPPPDEGWKRDLWLLNAAGFIVMHDIRERTRAELSDALTDDARHAAEAAIDATIYNFMMVADHVIGGIRNGERALGLSIGVELTDSDGLEVVQQLDLFSSDGACMAFHSWVLGDFGDVPIATPSSSS